jgi:hypothetical protein
VLRLSVPIPLIVALSLLAALAVTTPAQAGPPDPYAALVVEDVQLSSGDGCAASVAWSGLRGGKPLFVEVRLTFNNGQSYQTSWVANADEIYKVKQNSGSLAVGFPGAAAADGTTDHRVNVSFMDREGTQIGPTYVASAAC